MGVGLHSLFCWASKSCLCLLQRQRAEQEARNSRLVGKQAAFQSMDGALHVLRSMKLIKIHVVGQCQVSVPSE